MSDAGDLDERTLRRLFVQDVQPMAFADAKPAERPVVVIVSPRTGTTGQDLDPVRRPD